jgi:uncharacterized protein YndB with AHSA1/START domain
VSTPALLPHQLDRTVVIQAPPETVFRFFTDPVRWASWWGKGSTIDARPGGTFLIQYPGDTQAAGDVIEVTAPRRIVLTYGYVSGKLIPVGGSRVTIDVQPHPRGSRVHLRHEVADAQVRDEHIQGWRYQLSLFANVVADEVAGNATASVDAWFEAWAETDATKREQLLGNVVSPEVRFQDRYSNLEGLQDLLPHIAASQHFMPDMRIRRAGEPRHCQGTLLCDWIASGSDGQPKAQGTNVFVLGPTGRIEWVTGFWAAPSTAGSTA